VASIGELRDRRAKIKEELSEIDAEIRTRHGETDESLDPDPAKAKPAKSTATTKKA
jgi:hypothetical protein